MSQELQPRYLQTPFPLNSKGKAMSDFLTSDDGRPQMVNVGEKTETRRVAVAGGRVTMSKDTLNAVKSAIQKRRCCLLLNLRGLWEQNKPRI